MKVLLLCVFGLVAGCAGSPAARPSSAPPPNEPPEKACDDAFQDLARYYADPERPRPAGFSAGSFVAACRELPWLAQKCLLFSYMQSHTAQCDEALKQAPPDAMARIGAMTGK